MAIIIIIIIYLTASLLICPGLQNESKFVELAVSPPSWWT